MSLFTSKKQNLALKGAQYILLECKEKQNVVQRRKGSVFPGIFIGYTFRLERESIWPQRKYTFCNLYTIHFIQRQLKL